MLRTILALALASSAWAVIQADTICSLEPTICDGTYSGTSLCAPLHRPPCTMHQREGVATCLQGLGERRREGTEGSPRAGVGWRRVVATRRGGRHTAHLVPAADLMLPRAPLSTPPPLRRPFRRSLGYKDLDGSVPTQLGLLTALKNL